MGPIGIAITDNTEPTITRVPSGMTTPKVAIVTPTIAVKTAAHAATEWP
jgi:hypothetical protein